MMQDLNLDKLKTLKEIELFSRKNDVLTYTEDARITPVHISNEISSFSAILLNDEYYYFLLSGLTEINDIQILSETHIIPFKAKAWLDLSQRKEDSQKVDTKNITKHKNDVFRLSQLLSLNTEIDLPGTIKTDMQTFLIAMESEDIILKDIDVLGTTKEEILLLLTTVYLR